MIDTAARKELAIALWVSVAGVAGHACLFYAIFRANGDQIRSLVNRIIGSGV